MIGRMAGPIGPLNPLWDSVRWGPMVWDVWLATTTVASALSARRNLRLNDTLAHALRASPFYRRHLAGCSPGHTALATLPVVTRSQLMQNFDDWVTDPALQLQPLKAHLADPQRLGQPVLGRYMVWESSGTSGEPGVFVQDAQALAVYDALESVRRNGLLQEGLQALWSATLRMALVTATGGHFASVVSLQRLRERMPWAQGLMQSVSLMQPPEALLAQLQTYAPQVVATYPTAAMMLADATEQGRLPLSLSQLMLGGEHLSAAMRQRLGQVFGCPVHNSYGASEFLPIAGECIHGSLHVNADWVILEAVDEHYRPVPPGVRSHSCLLTHLCNRVQPLIRYELGDRVTLTAKPCRCGSALPVIEVEGRRDEALTLRAAQGHAVTLLPLVLSTVLEEQAGVFDFHLRQIDDTTLGLSLGASYREDRALLARCCAVLRAFARTQGLPALKIRPEAARSVPLGRSGKAQRIVGLSDSSSSGRHEPPSIPREGHHE